MSETAAVVTVDYSRNRSSRLKLSESQLLKHGQGACDLRTAIVLNKPPAGFIRLSTSTSPPTSPTLGPPPVFNPTESLYFPPVVLVQPPFRPSVPEAPPPFKPETEPEPEPESEPKPARSLCERVPSPAIPAPSPPNHRSSRPKLRRGVTSGSTLVQSPGATDVASGSNDAVASAARHSRRSKDLSLTEILDISWHNWPASPAQSKGHSRSTSGSKGSPRPSIKRRNTYDSVEKRRSSVSSIESLKESSKSRALDWEMEEARRKLKKLEVVEGAAPQMGPKSRQKLEDVSQAAVKIKHSTQPRAVDIGTIDRSLMTNPS